MNVYFSVNSKFLIIIGVIFYRGDHRLLWVTEILFRLIFPAYEIEQMKIKFYYYNEEDIPIYQNFRQLNALINGKFFQYVYIESSLFLIHFLSWRGGGGGGIFLFIYIFGAENRFNHILLCTFVHHFANLSKRKY